MLYRLIMFIAVIGLVQETAAAEIDITHPSSAPTPSYVPISEGLIATAPPVWLWTGFYGGLHVGIAAGKANFANPLGSSIFGDDVITPSFLAGGQVGFNWQLPNSDWVLGIEADASWLTSDGTNTCLASSGLFVSATCRATPNLMADLTGRVGWAYGQFDHSLVYVKGGAAYIRSQVDLATNAATNFVANGVPQAPLTTSSSFAQVGWIVGTGVEHAITPAWSVKLEYDYAGFGGVTVATPPSFVQPIPGVNGYNLTPSSTTRVTQNFQAANLALNYKLGANPSDLWEPISAFPPKRNVLLVVSGWDVDIGVRDWYSSGRFQKDLGSTTNPALANILNSRLTYNTTANSGELFGRIEGPQNVFVKGNIGIGSILNGQLNDEDWAIFGGTVPYSNTTSSVKGKIAYTTVDLGYDFFRGAGYKLGAFVGYNYFKENKSAYGCTQIANQLSDCVPSIGSSVLGITENDIWNSLRVGVAGDIMVTNRAKLGADVAYLPYVQFNGTDDHVLRSLISPESGRGVGLQLEGIISYLFTEQFAVGLGARYWAMWTTKDAITEFGGAACPCQTLPAKTDRFGAFVQVDYWGISSLLDRFKWRERF